MPSRHLKLLAAAACNDTLQNLRNSIKSRQRELLPPPHFKENLLIQAIHTGVLAPGKRFRSVLMLLTCNGPKGNAPAVLDLACAVEMKHTASLFMDGLACMDNAQTRRGQRAVDVQYGEDIAMLAAVALISEVLRLVASVNGLPADSRARLVVTLSSAIGPQGWAKGQHLDLRNANGARGEFDIERVNQQKTSVLFTAALDMAATASGATDVAKAALRGAATSIGQALQMRDNLEDKADAAIRPMKDRNKDIGKTPMVSLLGRKVVEARMRKHLGSAVSHLRMALPRDTRLVDFTLQAFGLHLEEIESAANGKSSFEIHRDQFSATN